MAAPCTALMPTPPQPTMTTVSPGCTSAAYVAEPQPVVTPQPTSAALSRGMSSSILMQLASLQTVYGENVPMQHITPRSSPPLVWWREVKSVTWRPREQEGAEVAQVLPAASTRRAPAARRDEAEADVIARLESHDPRSDLDDLTGAFMAADDRELLEAELVGDLGWHDHVAGHEVLVRMAQPGAGQLHQHLARLGRIERDVLDAPVGVRPPENRGLRVHLHPPVDRLNTKLLPHDFGPDCAPRINRPGVAPVDSPSVHTSTPLTNVCR